MNISGVQAQLTADDILSIINEFVDVDGLKLSEVIIDHEIKIKGEFSKGITVHFEGTLRLEGVREGKIYGRFSNLKLMNLGFFRPIRSLALKLGLKNLTVNGIEAKKDQIIIDVDKILNPIPFINLNIKNIFVNGQVLNVEVEKINISLKGDLIKEEIEEVLEETEDDNVQMPVEKVKDYYSFGREAVEEKMSPQVKKVSDYLFVVPDIVALIYILLKDNRVPFKTKMIMSASLAYVITPADLIPNKIPFIGRIDDVAVVFFALNRIANDVKTEVILENWSGKNELILVLRNGLEYIINFTRANNVEKLYNIVEELATL